MTRKTLISILTLFILLSSGRLSAQKATTSITPSSFQIGDPAIITLQLKQLKDQSVIWPKLADSTASYKIDIIEQGVIDTLKSDSSKWVTYSQKLKVTTFDTGSIVITPLAFYAQDSTLIAISDSLNFTVATVPVDTSKAFMDINGVLDEPLRFSEILPIILYILGGILLIVVVIIVILRRKKKKPLFTLLKTKEALPHEFALEALKGLQERRLWQQGQVKEYYVELSNILRIYITNQFHIDAMEMLSSEIIQWMSTNPDTAMESNNMRALFSTADLVKFAKASPLPNENDLYLNYAFGFVNTTKPLTEAQPTKNSSKENNQNNNTL